MTQGDTDLGLVLTHVTHATAPGSSNQAWLVGGGASGSPCGKPPTSSGPARRWYIFLRGQPPILLALWIILEKGNQFRCH